MFPRTFIDDFTGFRRAFDQVFENFLTAARRSTSENTDVAFVPAVETGWTDDFLNLRVVLPGVTQDNLSLTRQGSQLVIQGERRAPADFGKDGTIYNQLAYGKFERTLELPNGLDADKMQAHLHDGLLDIRIPIAQAVKPKQVPVKVGSGDQHKSIAA